MQEEQEQKQNFKNQVNETYHSRKWEYVKAIGIPRNKNINIEKKN